MPYFQNVFESEFVGALVLGDRQLSLNFRVRGNVNTSTDMVAWNREPYDLGYSHTLTFNYSFDSGRAWAALPIDVTTAANNVLATTCAEVAAALNANATFAELYNAYTITDPKAGNFLKIRARKARERWKTYISNSSAEAKLRFNKKAGVAELPTYFSRHTIANINTYDDCIGMLIELSDPVSGVDVNIVEDAGQDSSVVLEDWELLAGRSGIFTFRKQTVDTSDRITEIIEYPAGAGIGDFAKKITMAYDPYKTNPKTYAEIPYVLQSGDLITPP